MVERLIAAGHAGVWSYTPRQALAFADLLATRQRADLAALFAVSITAARGGKTDVRKLSDQLAG